MSDSDRIGLIAGGGRLPFMVAAGVRKAGRQVICVGLADYVEPALAHLPFTVLGAFPEADVLGQDFGPLGATLRFRLPPESAERLERAWQERSRGGQMDWA